MPVGRAIQFRGINTVLDCYKNNNIPAFAVCYDKNINFKYSGDDMQEGETMLQSFLELLKKHDSNATYTLRLYEDLNGKQIRSNTDYDMSFNFVLNEEAVINGNLPAVQSGFSNSAAVQWLTEISNLKTEKAVLEMHLEQSEEYVDVLEKEVTELRKTQQSDKSMGASMFEKILPGLVGKIFNFGPEVSTSLGSVSVDDEQLIRDSITRLKGKTGEHSLGQVLNKLADVAENSKDQFLWYLSMLMK